MKQQALEYIRQKNAAGLARLFEKGLDPNESYLREAIRQVEDNDELRKVLIDYRMVSGLAPGFREAYFAVKEGNLEKLLKLLDDGLDINARDNQNCSLFIIAAKFNQVEIMRLLIAKGADLVTNPEHFNPELNSFMKLALHNAIIHNSPDSLGLLVTLAEVSEEDKAFAYFLAAEEKNNKALTIILDAGLDPNVLYKGIPVLTHMVNRLHIRDAEEVREIEGMIRLLIDRGVNPGTKDENGLTAAETAFETQGSIEFGYFLRSLENKTDQLKQLKDCGFPEEVLRYLDQNRDKLRFDFSGKGELSYVQLCAPEELRFTDINLNPKLYYYEIPEAADDPNGLKWGNYRVPAVDIIKDCSDYDPWGILVWLPSLNVFATADTEHGEVHVFLDTSWERILNSLEAHCCYQWEDYNEEVNGGYLYDVVKPWEVWDFVEY